MRLNLAWNELRRVRVNELEAELDGLVPSKSDPRWRELKAARTSLTKWMNTITWSCPEVVERGRAEYGPEWLAPSEAELDAVRRRLDQAAWTARMQHLRRVPEDTRPDDGRRMAQDARAAGSREWLNQLVDLAGLLATIRPDDAPEWWA